MNTATGTTMLRIAPAVSSCQAWFCWPTSPATVTGTTALRPGPGYSRGISRSFQVHRNWKMAKEARAGTDMGTICRQNVLKWLAPSILADSITALGKVDMEFGRVWGA